MIFYIIIYILIAIGIGKLLEVNGRRYNVPRGTKEER